MKIPSKIRSTCNAWRIYKPYQLVYIIISFEDDIYEYIEMNAGTDSEVKQSS